VSASHGADGGRFIAPGRQVQPAAPLRAERPLWAGVLPKHIRPQEETMKRRDFIKLGSCGLAALALNGLGGLPAFLRPGQALAGVSPDFIDLTMQEVDAEMVDRTVVYMWAFSTPTAGPRIPGPVILAREGEKIRLRLRNQIDRAAITAWPFRGYSPPSPFLSGRAWRWNSPPLRPAPISISIPSMSR
jgi:hypothetical protein